VRARNKGRECTHKNTQRTYMLIRTHTYTQHTMHTMHTFQELLLRDSG
jgi:hypothetical protein